MIAFENVSKTYRTLLSRRPVRAVEEFSLEVHSGEIFGIAGPNGAGKSTLINILLGFLSPSSGRATIAGLAARDYIERHGAGYLSELVAIPPAWRVRGVLRRYALLARIPAAERSRRWIWRR